MRINLTILFLTLSTLSVFAQNPTQLDTVSIELKWYHQFQFAGYYAADINGFYQEEGLHVNIIEGGVETDQLQAVLSGDVEFGIYDSGLLIDYANGAEVVVLKAIFQYSPNVIAARADRNFTTLADLANAKIMTGDGIGVDIMKSIFIEQGINVDSMKTVPFDFERFKNDPSVDAINSYITAEIPLLQSEGFELDIFYPWRYGIDFYGDVLFTSSNYLENNRDIVERFQRATVRGWQYAREHEEEIINYVLTLDGVTDRGFTFDRLQMEAEKTWEYTIPDKIPIGFMSESRWEIISSYFQKSGIINSAPDISEFMIQPVTPLPQKLLSYLNEFLIGLVSVLVIVILWILILRKEVKSKTRALSKSYNDRLHLEKQANEQLNKSLREKEVILAEVHHRVKNNMALITSLIELQRQEIDAPDADIILKEAQLRIHTIAEVHEQLYDQESFTKIPFREYVNLQIENVLSYIRENSTDITIENETDNLSLNINYSIPLALIINECLTNCVNHAFKGRDQGKINVQISSNNQNSILLSIADDGIGFNTDPSKYSSVGVTIIRALAQQIDAELSIDSSNEGTKVSVSFTVSD